MKASVISKVMAEMGRKGGKAGGKKGGRARMAAMSSEERSALARRAAQARWGAKSETVTEIAAESTPGTAAISPQTVAHPITASGIEQPKEVAEVAAAAAAGAGVASPVSSVAPAPKSAVPSPVPTPTPADSGTANLASSPDRTTPPPTPLMTPGFSPVSENLVAARVNAGKHYDGIDWSEEPKPAGPDDADPSAGPERIQVRRELAQVLASLAAELELGLDSEAGSRAEDTVASTLRRALETTRGATAALPGIRPKEEDQIRQTLFLLDEVRMTLGDDRAISLRSARKALKLWAGPEDRP